MKVFRSLPLLLLAALPLAVSACAPLSAVGSVTPPQLQGVTEGIQLAYELRGAGEPVVLVHGGVFGDWFKPLLAQPALAERHRLLSYHRIGYGGSGRSAGAASIQQQAAQLRVLMFRLGITRAHIVGHSSGGNIALQLALDAPEMVQSLALLEPALTIAPEESPTSPPARNAAMGTVINAFRAGQKEAAVDGFMRLVAGPDYRAPLDQALPGWHQQAIAAADIFFGEELPAVQQWSFRREDAACITAPVLAVIGEKSSAVSPTWPQRQQRLLTWLPHAEPFVLPGATHLLHVQNPRGMAQRLAVFFAQHALVTPP